MTWIEGRKSIWKISVSFRFQVVPTLTRVCSFWLLNTTLSPLSSSLHTEDEQVSAVWGDNVLVQTLDVPPPPGWPGLQRQNYWLIHQPVQCLPPPLGSPSWLVDLLCSVLLCSPPSPALKHHGGLNDPACKKYCEEKGEEEMDGDGEEVKDSENVWHFFFFFFEKTTETELGVRRFHLGTFTQNHSFVAVRTRTRFRPGPGDRNLKNSPVTQQHHDVLIFICTLSFSTF